MKGQTPGEPGAVTDALRGMWQRSQTKLLARVDVLDEAVAEERRIPPPSAHQAHERGVRKN